VDRRSGFFLELAALIVELVSSAATDWLDRYLPLTPNDQFGNGGNDGSPTPVALHRRRLGRDDYRNQLCSFAACSPDG
jgi:hypothetical protein